MGAPVTLDAQGNGTIKLSPKWSDQGFTLTQAVNGQESVPASVAIPLLAPEFMPFVTGSKMVALIGKPNTSFEVVREGANRATPQEV